VRSPGQQDEKSGRRREPSQHDLDTIARRCRARIRGTAERDAGKYARSATVRRSYRIARF
jgi:hypothetical protein